MRGVLELNTIISSYLQDEGLNFGIGEEECFRAAIRKKHRSHHDTKSSTAGTAIRLTLILQKNLLLSFRVFHGLPCMAFKE